MEDMNQVIEDAVNDATADEVVDETPEVDASVPDGDASAEVDAEPAGEPMTKEEREQAEAAKVAPMAKAETDPAVKEAEDEFAKKFGIASKSVTGRENRLPYSRVKKIVQKNEQEVTARVTKEIEAKYQPQIQEFEAKAKRLADYENVLENDPKTFLERLSQVPTYKPFFDWVNQLAAGAPPAGEQPPAQAAPAAGDDPRPLPNKQLADGSKVYDLEGLDQLMAWQARQVEKKVATDLETKFSKRYEPIEAEWKQKEYLAKIAPQIEKQIAEARTWPLFTENEGEITKALQADPNLSLEAAWRQIAVPKMVSDRTKMRTEVLAELKKAPASTAVPGAKMAPGTPKAGPRSLEDIIAAEIAKVSGQ